MKSQEIIDESYENSGKIADHIEDKEDKEAQMAYAKERKEFAQRLEQDCIWVSTPRTGFCCSEWHIFVYVFGVTTFCQFIQLT